MNGILRCSGLPIEVKEVPEIIRILPIGEVKSRKGDFIVDDESVELIKLYFSERKVDLVIDYEHQSLDNTQAPAAGWITEIGSEDGAVTAKVKWTDKAGEYLRNREYRYLSPVVLVRKSDRRAVAVQSVALTNTPAIDGMFPVVNSLTGDDDNEEPKEEKMDIKELRVLLGLDENATEKDVKKKLAEIKEKAEKQAEEKPIPVANSVVLSLLGLDEKAKTEDVVTAVMSFNSHKADEEKEELKKKLEEREAGDLVQTALKDGKISAAQKEWAMSYALSDKEGFKNFLDKAPGVVPMGRTETVQTVYKTEAHDELTAKILKDCSITDEDVEKYFKTRQEEI